MDPDQFDRLIRLQTQFLRIQRDLLNASFDLEELTRELLVANPPPITLERSILIYQQHFYAREIARRAIDAGSDQARDSLGFIIENDEEVFGSGLENPSRHQDLRVIFSEPPVRLGLSPLDTNSSSTIVAPSQIPFTATSSPTPSAASQTSPTLSITDQRVNLLLSQGISPPRRPVADPIVVTHSHRRRSYRVSEDHRTARRLARNWSEDRASSKKKSLKPPDTK